MVLLLHFTTLFFYFSSFSWLYNSTLFYSCKYLFYKSARFRAHLNFSFLRTLPYSQRHINKGIFRLLSIHKLQHRIYQLLGKFLL